MSIRRDMLAELREDNKAILPSMREAHHLCDEENDVATTSLLENWIDETRAAHLVPLRNRTGQIDFRDSHEHRAGIHFPQVCYHPQLGPIQTCDTFLLGST